MILGNFLIAAACVGILSAGETNLIILADMNSDESPTSSKRVIVTRLCEAVLSAKNPILVTPSLFTTLRVRAERFKKAREAREKNTPVVLDSDFLHALKSIEPTPEKIAAAYAHYVDAVNTADTIARNISLTSLDRCTDYKNVLTSQSFVDIPDIIR